MTVLTIAGARPGGSPERSKPVRVTCDGGMIVAVEGATGSEGGNRLLLPAFANAHDHARPLALSSFGAAFMPLETWLPRSMLATPPDAYLAAAVPLARAARSGCGSVMVHYTRPSGVLPLPEEAAAVARAGRDVGVRIAFALALRDQNPLVYGDHTQMLAALDAPVRAEIERWYLRPALPVAELMALVDAISESAASPMVDVQYGPAGVQWCSKSLLEAVAARSAETGRRVHMHLLETPYQRAWADRHFPQGIVRYLDDIGLLSERLALIHCIYARPDELELIAKSGATIVTNFSSNLQIRSGLGPIREAIAKGCKVAVGLDGLAFDEDDDIVREMRLVHAMHGGWGFEDGWSRDDFLRQVIANGRRVTGAPGHGDILVGEPADLVSIDLDKLDRDRLVFVDPLDLLFARGNASYVADVVVAGRRIVHDGRVTGIDLPAAEQELRALYRAHLPKFDGLIAAWPQVERAIRNWICDHAECC